MKKIITLLIFICSISTVSSQKIKFVNAVSGLVIRDAPNKNAKRIDRLNYGVSVNVVSETGIKISINDDNKVINGQWVEITRPKENKKGFVFDGFLTSEVVSKGKESENFYITEVDSLQQRKYWNDISNLVKPKPISVFLRNKLNQDILEFKIPELESYEKTDLHEIEAEKLTNIDKIIIIESTYSACCSSTDEFYYLLNFNNDLIALPKVNNTHCDGPEPFFGYLFPNDENAEKDKIIYAKITPTQEGINEKIDILKIYSWTGTKLKVISK